MNPTEVVSIPIPALYLHIPFCRNVCPFCSFAVMKDNPGKHKEYLCFLKKELTLISEFQVMDFSRLESVYLGGGTPSRLEETVLQELVEWLNKQFAFGGTVDWSMEVNPEDIDTSYAQLLLKLGFSRISVGVQSFNDDQLKTLNRQHRAQQARNCLEALQQQGIENLNIDLMFGYPGQTIQSLKADLDEVISYGVKHVSVYSLTIEPKTALYRKAAWRDWIAENEELITEMYHLIVNQLAASGLMQYEVSNFCRTGYESTQNLIYWQNRNYLGLGVGAHSHGAPYRWGNVKRLVDYKKLLDNNRIPHFSLETIDRAMRRDEELMLGLRLKKGLKLSVFTENHQIELPESWYAKVSQFREHGLLEDSLTHLSLSTKGMLLADEISSTLAATLP